MPKYEFTGEADGPAPGDKPNDGETVLRCAHRDGIKHMARIDPPARYCRLDDRLGSLVVEATWVAVCAECFQRAGDDITTIEIAGHGVVRNGRIDDLSVTPVPAKQLS